MKKVIFTLLYCALHLFVMAQLPSDYPSLGNNAKIVAVEYFIDNDPGFGQGTQVSLVSPYNDTTDISSMNFVVNIPSNLPKSVHTLYVRTKDVNGVWSITNINKFDNATPISYETAPAAKSKIVAVEYFIDTDPGFGQGTQVSLVSPFNDTTDISSMNFSVNIPSNLPKSLHTLYIRTKDANGVWSIININKFDNAAPISYVTAPAAKSKIVTVEYFIDTDPGFGQGTQVSLVSPFNDTTDISGMNFSVNIPSNLPKSVHTLYIRTKDANGVWSITNINKFDNAAPISYVTAPAAPNKITRLEYFIDTDPGFGNGISFDINPSKDVTITDSIVKIPAGLSAGTHHLFFRSFESGKWSIVNQRDFLVYVSPFVATPSVLNFGSVAVGYTKMDSIMVKNVSTSSKTVNSISLPANFSSTFSGPVTLAANTDIKIYVSFAPTAQLFYSNDMSITTSDGLETVTLQGLGAAAAPSWSITPVTFFDFGNVEVSQNNSFNYTVTNTGNTPINITDAYSLANSAFTVSAPNTHLAIGASTKVLVTFAPTEVNQYTDKLVLKSASTSGLDSITSSLFGSSYIQGTAPVLQFVSTLPYNNTKGVDPEASQLGNYTYKVIYKSSNNLPPQTGYPKVSIDKNADGDFSDLGEGSFTMSKVANNTNYVAGVEYIYTVNFADYSSTLGYRFSANDSNGNAATTNAVNYNVGPVVTNQALDLRIFASDINFSNSNPDPNQPFVLSAQIHNTSPFSAINVPVKFYMDSILLDSTIVPSIGPYSSQSISKVFSFAKDGFYPIKVWIDSARTLSENNVLNNYAIRPVTVGLFSVPGGINLTTVSTVQTFTQGGNRIYQVLVNGTAQYYGTSTVVQPMVAGAQVQIIHGTDTVYTTTNSSGIYSYLFTVNCTATVADSFTFKVIVTDFTFTGRSNKYSVFVPCISTIRGQYIPDYTQGYLILNTITPCSLIANRATNFTFNVTYQGRPDSVSSPYYHGGDYIADDTVSVYQDGYVIYRKVYRTDSGQIGTTFSSTISLNPTTTGQTVVKVEHKYAYHAFTMAYRKYTNQYGVAILDDGFPYYLVDSSSLTTEVKSDKPNLNLYDFYQQDCNTFHVTEYNSNCVNAGLHHLKIYDSTSGGSYTLLRDITLTGLGGMSMYPISISLPTTSYGFHSIKIVADANNQLVESDETDNTLEVLNGVYVCKPDLSVDSIRVSNSNPSVGTDVNFAAFIKNTQSNAATFKVSFTANGVLIGSKKVQAGLTTGHTLVVYSDLYNVTTTDHDCPVIIQAFVDCDNQIPEDNKVNNTDTLIFGADIKPIAIGEKGAYGNPFIVAKDVVSKVDVPIRNYGARKTTNVTVKYQFGGQWIGADNVASVDPGANNPATSSFYHTFTAVGDYVVFVTADTTNTICESDETNNTQPFYIRVTDGTPDFEVLSQYISPSNLNPNPNQSVTIVGTVKNIGTKTTNSNFVRFMIDNVQLGSDVAINPIAPGQDTTVSATVSYKPLTVGPKIMKLLVDMDSTEVEIREDNNLATRALVVGNAPDFARSQHEGITYSKTSYNKGDTITVCNYIRNYGGDSGRAYIKFYAVSKTGKTLIDSVIFRMNATDSARVCTNWVVNEDSGKIITEIGGCSPMEFNTFNNIDSLNFKANPLPDYVWTGSNSRDWFNNGNWSNGIMPTIKNDVIIPAFTTNQPILTTDLVVNNIALYGNLSLNNYTLTINGKIKGLGQLKGTPLSSLIMENSMTDTIYFGTSANDSLLYNFSVLNNGTVVLGTGLGLINVLTVHLGTLITNNKLTLKSFAPITAVVGPVTGTILGNVTVERYIPQGFKAFRQLSVGGVYDAGSIFNNWQERGSRPVGYGTFVTGAACTSCTGNSVDVSSGLDYTISGYKGLYNYSYPNWSAITNTKTINLNPFTGYHLLIYGNRTTNLFAAGFDASAMMSNATTLRTTGSLVIGTVIYSETGVTNTYNNVVTSNNNIKLVDIPGQGSFIANPYACAINWNSLSKYNLESSYWYFDPTYLTGGYQQYVAFNDLTNTNSNPLSSNINQYIQPGQAFWVQADSNVTAGSGRQLEITENDKITTGFNTAVFKGAKPNRIIATIWKKDATNTLRNMDGAVAVFGAAFNKTVGKEDGRKFWNNMENITINESGSNLCIDGLPLPKSTDSIYLKLTQMTANKTYTLRLDIGDYTAVSGMNPYLLDRYLNTETALTTDSSLVSFTPTTNAATYSNRFVIVFKPSTTLPVQFVSINATHVANGNMVKWVTAEAGEVMNYIVESSSTGTEFKSINTSAVNANNEYKYVDEKASGKTYYRIKAVSKNGQIDYSKIVLVNRDEKGSMVIVPNPVENGNMNIAFNNMVKGNYSLVMYSRNGQEVFKISLNINEGSSMQIVPINQKVASGIYTIKLLGTDYLTNVIIK